MVHSVRGLQSMHVHVLHTQGACMCGYTCTHVHLLYVCGCLRTCAYGERWSSPLFFLRTYHCYGQRRGKQHLLAAARPADGHALMTKQRWACIRSNERHRAADD